MPLLGLLRAGAFELAGDLVHEWRALCPPRLRRWLHQAVPQVHTQRVGGELAIASSEVAQGVEVALMLPEADVLRLELELPGAAVRDIRQAVAYRLLRDSPLACEQMLFDTRPQPRSRHGVPVTVAVAMCHRHDVEEALALARKSGISVATVGLPGAPGGDDSRAWVFHTSEGARANRRRQRWNRRLAASAVLGVCALFIFGLGLAHWQQARLRTEAARLMRIASADTEILAQEMSLQALRDRLRDELPARRLTSFLNELAVYLPADAWLDRSEFADGALVLGGQAAEPSRALAALKQSSLLAGIRLDSVASSANPGEPPQFAMSLSLKPGRD